MGCTITLSNSSNTRPNPVSRILSELEDNLLYTEHIPNPTNKCLPLRVKGRIHETASKRGLLHIRLDIGEIL